MSGFGGLLSGHALLGRYRIGTVIGRGGFAVVYEAHDERLDRAVAVKVITLGGPESSVEEELHARFQREARASASLQHPNVVGVFDFGNDPDIGIDFLVMERLRGQDLRTRLRRPEPIPLDEAMHVLRSAAAGVGAGHEAGIIHRDVKPANIFLTESRQGDFHNVRVLDFGIALLAAADDATRLTRNGVPLSVPYASPEQLSGDSDLTPASDVFGLGAVAYEMLARRRPFAGNLMTALEERLGTLPPLAELNPEVPPHVAAAVHRAMHPDPTERFADANEVARALNAEAAPGPTAAEPAPVVVPAAAAAVIPAAAATEPPSPSRPPLPAPSRRKIPRVAMLGVLAAALAGGAVLLSQNADRGDPPPAARAADTPQPGLAERDSAPAGVRATDPSTAGRSVPPADTPAATAPAIAAAPPGAGSTPARPSAADAPTSRPAATSPAAPAAQRPVAAAPERRPAPAETRTPPASTPARSAPAPTRTATSAPAPAARGPEFRENLSHPCQSRPTATAAGACLRQDLARADRELNAVYQRVLSRLSPAQRRQLRQSQREWLVRYDRVITSYYSTTWGNHSRIEVLPSQIQALRDRTEYLRRVEGGGRI